MNRQQAIGLLLQRLERGSGTNCAQYPAGRSGNWFLTPFPDAQCWRTSSYRLMIEVKKSYSMRVRPRICSPPVKTRNSLRTS